MGNSMMSCGGSGERLITAARDGDVAEAKKLLDGNPNLANCSTFGLLNSPLNLASARGHSEVVALLLESGADVNSRNIHGQTPLMQACRYGHWEVVQNLLIYKTNVFKVESLSNKTALHFAATNGHIRCIRLLAAEFGPSKTGASILSSKTVDNIETGQNRNCYWTYLSPLSLYSGHLENYPTAKFPNTSGHVEDVTAKSTRKIEAAKKEMGCNILHHDLEYLEEEK